ncbi:MAG TPA: tryptophan synthase subunit alpha, partial [Porticoccaceae bacterium]
LDPVLLMTPTSTERSLQKIGAAARGMIYAVARKGVTGAKTDMGDELDAYLARCRRYTDLPIGVGFGVSSKDDIDFLRGRADMVIIGTAALRAWEDGGADGLRSFFSSIGI